MSIILISYLSMILIKQPFYIFGFCLSYMASGYFYFYYWIYCLVDVFLNFMNFILHAKIIYTVLTIHLTKI